MLSRFRRPEADLRVLLTRTVLHAGDELNARVELVPKSSFLVREGRVELICTETYVQKTSSQYGTHYTEENSDQSQGRGNFFGQWDPHEWGEVFDRLETGRAGGRTALNKWYEGQVYPARYLVGCQGVT